MSARIFPWLEEAKRPEEMAEAPARPRTRDAAKTQRETGKTKQDAAKTQRKSEKTKRDAAKTQRWNRAKIV